MLTSPLRAAAVAVIAVGVVACGSGGAASNATPQGSSGTPTTTSTPLTLADHAPTTGTVRLTAVGDTILGNTPSLPSDPATYLDAVKSKIDWPHTIRFANLEGTLTTVSGGKCGGSNGGTCFAFRNPPGYAKYLHRDGFTVLNNANNHSHDFGDAGLAQTIHAIHHHHMQQTGQVGEITIVHDGNIPVAMLGFAPYSNTASLLNLKVARQLIRKARTEARVVIVYMHAGAEGSTADHVTGHEEYYVGEDRGNAEKFAHLAINNGASLVIASGPHVVRGMQFYKGHLIAYSLGNFANFHNFGTGGILSDSAILHVALTATGGFKNARLFGVALDGEGHPTLGGGTGVADQIVVEAGLREVSGSHRLVWSDQGVLMTRPVQAPRRLGSPRQPGEPPRPIFNPYWLFGLIIVVLLVLIVGDKIYKWHHNKAPFGPDAIDAKIAGLQVLTPTNGAGSNVHAALEALGDQPNAATFEVPTARHLHWQYVVGRLDVATHSAPAGSQYWLVVIDNRTHQVVSLSGSPETGSSSANGSGSGWDGTLNAFASKYSWLAPLADTAGPDGTVTSDNTTVNVVSGQAIELPFSGPDRNGPAPITDPSSQLTVALLMEGPDGQTWWAKRLT